MSKDQTIIDFVNSCSGFQGILRDLLERRFLQPWLSHPGSYLIDVKQITAAWTMHKSKRHAIAMGVSRYHAFHCEIVNNVLAGKDPKASIETSNEVATWKAEIVEKFPSDSRAIESVCAILGQYLEYANRKSRGPEHTYPSRNCCPDSEMRLPGLVW